jgi:pSer/pThr/pTyr-binding forkhead associated (FHA) protein
MIQLSILSGKMAGDTQVVRHFPFRIGRAAENDLVLDDSGVWDAHFVLEFKKADGFFLKTAAEAFAAVNDQPQKDVRLRNGDIISFGSAKLQFWLAPPRQGSLRLREFSFWFLILAVTAFQFVLIYRLLK